MKTLATLTHQVAGRSRQLRLCTLALALSLPAALPSAALGDPAPVRQPWNIRVPRFIGFQLPAGHAPMLPIHPEIQVPAVPSSLAVPDGNKAFRVGHAFGTQQYSCLPSGSGFAWTLFGPQATLLNDDDTQILTHFLSPNPIESGKPRPTWQDSRDTSIVWGNKIADSADPSFVAPGAIKWLLLQVVGSQCGPTGGTRLTPTTYIHRLNTSGGGAPATGCDQSTVGTMALVPYMADYFFYKASPAN